MSPRRRRIGYLVALAGPVALSVLVMSLRDTAVGPALALVLVIPLVVGAALAGRGAGIGGAVVTAACFDYFLTRPYGSLTIHASEDVVTTLALLVVGSVVAELVVLQQRSDRRAAAHERDVRSLRRVAGVSAGGDDPGWLILAACSEVAEVLGVEEVDYEPGPPPPTMPWLGHGKVVVPATAATGTTAPTGDAAPPSGLAVALPIGREGSVRSHLVVHFTSVGQLRAVPSQGRAQAVAVADLLGGALARQVRPSTN